MQMHDGRGLKLNTTDKQFLNRFAGYRADCTGVILNFQDYSCGGPTSGQKNDKSFFSDLVAMARIFKCPYTKNK